MTAPATNNYGAMPGGFLSVSANGDKNGIVWASTPYNGDAVHQSVQGVLYAFDAATLNNVVHHVPVAERAALLREIRRTVAGPVYIKDHERRGAIDHWRLTALDAIGNIPFGGMLWARYLTATEWQALADEAGYRIAARARPKRYRAGPYALIFPNRLEVAMRFDPA